MESTDAKVMFHVKNKTGNKVRHEFDLNLLKYFTSDDMNMRRDFIADGVNEEGEKETGIPTIDFCTDAYSLSTVGKNLNYENLIIIEDFLKHFDKDYSDDIAKLESFKIENKDSENINEKISKEFPSDVVLFTMEINDNTSSFFTVDSADMNKKIKKEWFVNFINAISDEDLASLLVITDFLGVTSLFNLLCFKAASKLFA